MITARKGWLIVVLISAFTLIALADKAPLNLSLVWHQHQPMYWNRLTDEYELPWVRVHGVQEYIDSARISAEFPDINVTFNLQPSLLWQLEDYATITPEELADAAITTRVVDWDRAFWEFTAASGASSNVDRLGELDLPVLIITGDDDRIVPTADSMRLAEAIPGADLVVIPNCGHVAHQECDRVFWEAAAAWLAAQNLVE